MQFDPSEMTHKVRHSLVNSLVVPRPIAWVSSLDPSGVRNLAPHSYYNLVSATPPILLFSSSGGHKDTLANVTHTREFVINVVSFDMLEAMNLTSAEIPADEDEFLLAGLEACESVKVSPPRVARAAAALECMVTDIQSIGDGNVVFGEIVHIYINEDVWREDGVDMKLLAPVGRLGGPLYSVNADVLRITRPKLD